MTKAEWQTLWKTALLWSWDPVTRKCLALQRAERRGKARMMDPLERALADADAQRIQFHGQQLDDYLQVLKTITPLLATLQPRRAVKPPTALALSQLTSSPSGLPTYVISAATVAEAHAHVMRKLAAGAQEPEWMLAVTGVQQAHLRTLEHLLDVKLAQQSAVTAVFDMADFARLVVSLHELGMALHGIFHSHRFAGPPQPSAVDWRLQDLLDQGGYPAIQAVFSEDGYVRFFARRPFTLTIAGKGVDCVDQTTILYRHTHIHTLSHARALPPRPAGDAGLPPLSAHPRR